MSSTTEGTDDAPKIEIRRPLDIGYELLPEGVTAFDFIEYLQVPLQKPKLYHEGELPPHELMGDCAVIHRDLLEEDPTEHSQLWLKIVSKLNPELLPAATSQQQPEEEPQYLQCHLVDQPTRPRLLSSLLPRKHLHLYEEAINETNKVMMKTSMIDQEALDKMMETVNWLKYCQED